MSVTEQVPTNRELKSDEGGPRARIAFVCTRDPDYSRVAITRRGLESAFDVDPFISTKNRYLLRILSVVLQLIVGRFNGRLKRCDAVFVGFFAQPIFPLVRLLWRGPLISDAYFSMYDTMVNDKQTAKSGSLLGRLAHWLDHHMLSNSDCIFTDTNCHVEYLRQEFDVPDAPIYRLWISAQDDIFDDWKPRAFDPNQTFEVFFWGGFIPLQGVEVIIDAAGLLQDRNVRFTIFGSGQTLECALKMKELMGLENVEFHGWQPIQAVRDFAQKSHLALGIFGTTAKAKRVIPNKLFEAIAMGIPVITSDSPAVRELLTDGVNVILSRSGDPRSLADRIKWAMSHFDEATEIGKRGQERFYETASPDRVAEELIDRISQCLQFEGTRHVPT